MAHAAAEKESTPDAVTAFGVAPTWAAAFRAAARARAPRLARVHAATLINAYRRCGQTSPAAPRWRQPWPGLGAARVGVTLAHCRAMLAAAASAWRDDAGAWIEAAFSPRVLRIRRGPAQTRTRAHGPPVMQAPFDGGLPAAMTLAHEVAHWLQMGGLDGVSRRPPVFLAAETGALVFERVLLTACARTDPNLAYPVGCDDALAMLVRFPARAAWEQAEFHPPAWPAIAASFAPGQAWDEPPLERDRRRRPAGRGLAYAMAAALAAPIAARIQADPAAGAMFAGWLTIGPEARVEALSSLLPARLDDPSLYEAAYDDAERWIESPPHDRDAAASDH